MDVVFADERGGEHDAVGHHAARQVADQLRRFLDAAYRVSGPEAKRRSALELNGIHRDDDRRAANVRALDCGRSDASSADHDDSVAAAHPGLMDRRAVTGRNRAREQCSGNQRNTLVDLDDRVHRNDRVLREGADLGHVSQVQAVERVVAEGTVGRHARLHDPCSEIAEILHSRCTPTALDAGRRERRHDVVAGREPCDAFADFHDDDRTLVAADGRWPARCGLTWLRRHRYVAIEVVTH